MLKRFLRFITGFIFVVSGFVKALDVKGFSFKLEEYFSPQVFNIPFLEHWALPLAIIVVVLELVLGLMLMLKIELKKTLIALIALCLFFAFLTFYSAFYNVVTDCGCFGDAIKFTPWQSFFKDIILLGLLIVIYLMYKNNFNLRINQYRYSFLAVGIIVSLWIMVYGIQHEPIIDFRDYKIGTNLKTEKNRINAFPDVYTTFYTLRNKKENKLIKVSQNEYISKNYWKDSDWEIIEDQTTSELTKQGYTSEISKFQIETPNGKDITDSLISSQKTIIIFTYKPQEANTKEILDLENKLSKLKNTTIYGVSTDTNTFKVIPSALMDGTAIKTIARSNPSILILEHGTIVDKLSGKDYLN